MTFPIAGVSISPAYLIAVGFVQGQNLSERHRRYDDSRGVGRRVSRHPLQAFGHFY